MKMKMNQTLKYYICEIKVIKDVAYQQEVSDLDLEALKELED